MELGQTILLNKKLCLDFDKLDMVVVNQHEIIVRNAVVWAMAVLTHGPNGHLSGGPNKHRSPC